MAATAIARRPTSTPVRLVSSPRARIIRQAAVGLARRGATKAAQVAASEKHTLAALGTAAALGYMERSNVQVPFSSMLGRDGTVGAALWAFGRYSGNRTAQHMATGALSCAVKQMVVTGALPGATPAPAPAAPAVHGMQGAGAPAPQPGATPAQPGHQVMGGSL